MTLLISELERIVEAACASETNIFGYGIWTHHVVRVVEHGQRLANLCGADAEIIVIAALLHDYASIKDIEVAPNHHLHSALEADTLLTALGSPSERIEMVKQCILSHRASVPMARRSLEAQCLADADAMAHIEQVPSLLFYVFVQRRMDIASGTQWVREKLERSWAKLSRQAQDLMTEQYQAAIRTLTHSRKSSRRWEASEDHQPFTGTRGGGTSSNRTMRSLRPARRIASEVSCHIACV